MWPISFFLKKIQIFCCFLFLYAHRWKLLGSKPKIQLNVNRLKMRDTSTASIEYNLLRIEKTSTQDDDIEKKKERKWSTKIDGVERRKRKKQFLNRFFVIWRNDDIENWKKFKWKLNIGSYQDASVWCVCEICVLTAARVLKLCFLIFRIEKERQNDHWMALLRLVWHCGVVFDLEIQFANESEWDITSEMNLKKDN